MSRTGCVALAVVSLVWLACASQTARLGLAGDASPDQIQEAVRLGDLALDHYLAADARLQRISQTLRLVGAPLCEGEENAVLGLAVSGRREVYTIYREAAERRFADRRLRVTAVFEGMPAAKAGVQPGDVIESIGGKDVANFYSAYKTSGGSGEQVELKLERDGKPLVLQLERKLGCAYPAFLVLDDTINAFTPTEIGYTFYFAGLVRELDTDTLLALVVGHEMAHNIIYRLDAATPTSSRDNEARADYIGTYLAAAAGYPVSLDDTQLFNVLTRGDPNEIGKGKRSSHPMSSARTLALKQTIAEIRDKQARGETLRPEVR